MELSVRTTIVAVAVFAALTPSAAAADTAASLTAKFASMNGGGWTGGDAAWSVRLRDGRSVWLFADSFIGGVDAAGRRDPAAPLVRNSMVVERRDGSMRTIASAVPSATSDDWYWPGPPVLGRRSLQVLMAHIVRTGPGAWDIRAAGTSLAEFALPSLRLRSLTPLTTPPRVNMASAAVTAGRFTYVYGTGDSWPTNAFVARAPARELGKPWQYWTGSGWSASPARALPVASGVSDQFSVLRLGRSWLLVTQVPLSNTIIGFRASSPAGPWSQIGVLAEIPAIPRGMTYNATVHPEFSHGRNLVVGYSVNGADMDAVFGNAALYRPRFLSLCVACR